MRLKPFSFSRDLRGGLRRQKAFALANVVAAKSALKVTQNAFATLVFLASASAAAAHPGHFAEVAGHAHWIGLAAAGAAAVVAGWLAGKLSEDETDEETEAEEQDA